MAVEDFTTYTEVDPGPHLTVTSTKATIASGNDNNLYALYKDMGADFFDQLDVDFTIQLDTPVDGDSLLGMAVINTASPGTEEGGSLLGTTDLFCCMYWSTTTALWLNRGNFAAAGDQNFSLSTGTPYYCTVTRSAGGDTVTLDIYSNSGRTTLIDTLSVSGYGTVKWQYSYGFMNAEFNGNDRLNGFVENLDYNGLGGGGGGGATQQFSPSGGVAYTQGACMF